MFYILQTSLDHVKRRRPHEVSSSPWSSKETPHAHDHTTSNLPCTSFTSHSETWKLARCQSPTSRVGPGDIMQRTNSSVHLGSSLGQTQRSSQRLSQNRPPSDLSILFSLPHHPLEVEVTLHGGRVIRTECRGALPTGCRFQGASPIHRSHPGGWTPLEPDRAPPGYT